MASSQSQGSVGWLGLLNLQIHVILFILTVIQLRYERTTLMRGLRSLGMGPVQNPPVPTLPNAPCHKRPAGLRYFQETPRQLPQEYPNGASRP